MLYDILTYAWLAAMVIAVLATMVTAILARPKKPKGTTVAEEPAAAAIEEEPVLDFGDEVAQMGN